MKHSININGNFKMIQTIAKILLLTIMIPVALGFTMFTLPLAIVGLPFWILMGIAHGDSIMEAFGLFLEVAFVGFYVVLEL